MRRSALLLAFASLVAAPLSAQAPSQAPSQAPTVVIIVRHGHKAAQPANDPPLTDAGTQRAKDLAEMLKDSKVAAVLSTGTTRTRETARPTAEQFGLTVEPIAGNMAAMSTAVTDAAKKYAGKTILVVGHSNTVMPWINALGGPKRPDLCDHQYDGIYTLIIDASGTRLVEGRFGPPNPEMTQPCATMQTPR